jgi:hypothetical protein
LAKKGRKSRRRKAVPASALYSIGIVALAAVAVYLSVSLYGLFAPRSSREIVSSVKVLNGCGVEGVGFRAARHLRALGLDVVDFTNADSFDYEETIIVDRTGDMGAALEVARMLRVRNVIQQIPETPLVDIIVVIGADYESYLGA